MTLTRELVCTSAASKLTAGLAGLGSISVVVGLDGFVDEIISVVDKRLDHDRHESVRTIDAFGRKVLAAANQSTNFELFVKHTKLGGNGPIMANALATAGLKVTCMGSMGYPDIHPVFAELSRRADVLSIAPAGQTSALEFEDGKLMLGKLQGLRDINWDNLLARIGREKLVKLLNDASLIGLLNWTMLPDMSRIWIKVLEDIFPSLSNKRRTFFVDLADPQKRTAEDIASTLKIVSRFQPVADVVLGLNLKEATTIADVLGIKVRTEATEKEPGEGAIEETAQAIRQNLNIDCVVIHPRGCAAAASADQTAGFAGPFVSQPKISTGAGDHFNAGFCLARVLGMSLEECLCLGVASSGYYVRHAHSAVGAELAAFVAGLPRGEE